MKAITDLISARYNGAAHKDDKQEVAAAMLELLQAVQALPAVHTGLPEGVSYDGPMTLNNVTLMQFTDRQGSGGTFHIPAREATPEMVAARLREMRQTFADVMEKQERRQRGFGEPVEAFVKPTTY